MSEQVFEKIEVYEREASCDGGGGALGHPMIYLKIGDGKTSVTCPYCSREFILTQV